MSLSIGIDGAMYDVDISGSYGHNDPSVGYYITKWQSTDMWLKTIVGRFNLADVWNGKVFTINKKGPVAVSPEGYLEKWVEQHPEDMSAVRMLKATKCPCCGK